MRIPFLSLKETNQAIEKELVEAFQDFLKKGQYILGTQVSQFENSFATYCQQSYCAGVANGLDALILSLEAFKFKPGTEIIVPANTYFASILAIYKAGLQPVLVEPNLDDYLIDVDIIEKAISSKTGGILAVNLYGKMCNFTALQHICKSHNLKLIVDAAQSHGALFENTTTCMGADAVAYSFYPSKNLGAFADAGAVCTDNIDIYQNVKLKRNYGSKEKYVFEEKGINSRLSELQASFLNIKLANLNKEINTRRTTAAQYIREIKNEKVILPPANSIFNDAWHLFIVRTDNRRYFTDYLNKNEIGYDIHYPIPPHKQAAFPALNHLNLKITEKIHDTVVSLPLNSNLNNDEITYIIDKINTY